jgi:hypothetical protein
LPASPAEAAEAFRARRVAVLTCLTPAYVELRGYAPASAPHPFALAKGEAVRLGHSRVTEPHLHVQGEREIAGQPLGKLHLPTGEIRLEDIVALAIEELGAEPLREDWRAVLAAQAV